MFLNPSIGFHPQIMLENVGKQNPSEEQRDGDRKGKNHIDFKQELRDSIIMKDYFVSCTNKIWFLHRINYEDRGLVLSIVDLTKYKVRPIIGN